MWTPIAQAATQANRRRLDREAARQATHLTLLARYGLTPDNCPVCRNCPEVPR